MRKRSSLLLALAITAGVLTLLLVVAGANGVSPQQVLLGAFGNGGRPNTQPPQNYCCVANLPCPTDAHAQIPSYCCGCGCYAQPAQNASLSQAPVPCYVGGCSNTRCCACSPPPCTGLCPMKSPGTPTG